jgi:hypothetical protein
VDSERRGGNCGPQGQVFVCGAEIPIFGSIDPAQKNFIVLSHPSDKNKSVARVGHPNIFAIHVARVGHPMMVQNQAVRALVIES